MREDMARINGQRNKKAEKKEKREKRNQNNQNDRISILLDSFFAFSFIVLFCSCVSVCIECVTVAAQFIDFAFQSWYLCDAHNILRDMPVLRMYSPLEFNKQKPCTERRVR